MEEEFTTAMHEELIGEELPHLDLMVCGVYGAILRGTPLADALKKYKISESDFRKNIDRVLPCGAAYLRRNDLI